MATKEKEVDPVDDKDAIDALEAEAKEFDKVPVSRVRDHSRANWLNRTPK